MNLLYLHEEQQNFQEDLFEDSLADELQSKERKSVG